MSGILKDYNLINIGDTLISEAKSAIHDHKPLVVKGILQSADKKNRNGRIYPKNILESEVEKYQEVIASRRALGELDHPTDAEVSLSNASHIVTRMWWESDNLMGEIEILDTPSGKIAKQLIVNNVPLGISSRGVGSVQEENGEVIVQDDFSLICFDLVSTPSTRGAFLHESENLVGNDNNAVKPVDVSRFQEMSARILEKY